MRWIFCVTVLLPITCQAAEDIALQIDGVPDVVTGDRIHRTGETLSLRIDITVRNNTGKRVEFDFYEFKHSLAPVDDPEQVLVLRNPKHRSVVTNSDGNVREEVTDDVVRVNAVKEVEPHSSFSMNYPLACYVQGFDKQKEYLLTVEGLGQETSRRVRFK